MPKVLRPGIFSPANNFPQTPPAELKANCHFCSAELETEENEEKVEFAKHYEGGKRGGYSIPGWKIRCPECGKKVFFFDPKLVTRDVFNRMNGKAG